ncbi:MAG: SDR family NAD(P)-dependent oxidoreductase [Sinimarinibacterium flocculans]|uniref:SDR family NAD(P)-dependent oxidoreductase n=1 Tax=Sinimarinibacterium flocculans TaxID=985250 RepID=UPI003C5937B5
MTTHSNKGTALITGASSGIGAIYADRLARDGYDLILVARSADKLRDVAHDITRRRERSVETIAADLTRHEDLERIADVLRTDASITVLINNAGMGATAPMLDSDIAQMSALITLNVHAPTHLALAAAPAFVARGTGSIVNIASIVALAPDLLNGVYGASKAFVLALSQSLHHELAGKGIRVQAVLPGATATDFWSAAGTPVEHLPQDIVMSAEHVVDAALAGLQQGETVTIPSLPDLTDWETLEQARKALGPNLSRSRPASRYGLAA